MKVRAAVMGALAGAALLLAQAAPAGASEQAKPAVFVEPVRVTLVNVDVWVTVPDGSTAFGLREQDFELLEDGKSIPFSNFRAPMPPPVNPPAASAGSLGTAVAGASEGDGELTLVLLIDHDSVTPANRNAVLARLRPIFQQLLAAGNVRVMVATVNLTVRVRQALTARTTLLSDVFAALEGEVSTASGYADEQMVGRFLGGPSVSVSAPGSGGGSPGSGQPGSRGSALGESNPEFSEGGALLLQARASAQQIFERARTALASISRLLDSLANVPGRKVLFYVGNGIPIYPGADMLNAWEAQFGRSRGAAGFSAALEQENVTLAPTLRDVIAHANASRVTLYCVDTSTSKRVIDSSAESRPLSSNTGLGFGSDVGRRTFLQVLSSGTGGRVLTNSADLSADFSRSVEDLSLCYSLAFPTDHGGDGKLHTIAVKVRRGGTRVRYRESYVDKGDDDRMIDRSLAALYLGESPNPLAATLTLGTEIKQGNDAYVVPVIVNVPLGSLVLLPQGEVHVGSVSAWFAAADENGRVSQPTKQTFTFKVPNERLLTALSQNVSYPVQFLMKPGNKRVAASLRDDNSRTESTVITEFPVPRSAAGAAGARE